jgi:hypothetical protein
VPAGKGDDPGLSPSPFEGLPEGVAPPLVLSGAERTREALLASAIAVEFIRVVALSESEHPSDSPAQPDTRVRWLITVGRCVVVIRGCICLFWLVIVIGCARCRLGAVSCGDSSFVGCIRVGF